jgi:hypothetical protein
MTFLCFVPLFKLTEVGITVSIMSTVHMVHICHLHIHSYFHMEMLVSTEVSDFVRVVNKAIKKL